VPKKNLSPIHQLGYINTLRFLALPAVIMLHCSSPLLAAYGTVPHNQWLAADFYNALTRFAVPVFVMITGALLLGRDDEIFGFLKKRLSRVVIPFLFWSLVYVAYSYYDDEITYTGNLHTTINQVLHQLKVGAQYHLWYVYMLVGLYLIIPILSKFIRYASGKEILYFLAVWLLVMQITQPYMARYNPAVDTRYFAGYIGYLVLGYYLANKNFNLKHLSALTAGLLVVSVTVITIGTAYFFDHYHGISTVMYEPLSWLIVVVSSAIFLAIRFTRISAPGWFITLRDFVGKYNYGIYLGHALILTLLDNPDLTGFSLSFKSFNPFLAIPVTGIVCLLITLLMVYLINKLPFVGKYISG
jgi:surface polysaccharide O-acyltransferase-like enzyme